MLVSSSQAKLMVGFHKGTVLLGKEHAGMVGWHEPVTKREARHALGTRRYAIVTEDGSNLYVAPIR